MKCTNCNYALTDQEVLIWKCKKCGKLYKINVNELRKIMLAKEKKNAVSLVRCSGCGEYLDDSEEVIYWKCRNCEKIHCGKINNYIVFQQTATKNVKTDFDEKIVKKVNIEDSSKRINTGVPYEKDSNFEMKADVFILPKSRMQSEILPKDIGITKDIFIMPQSVGKKCNLKFQNSLVLLVMGIIIFVMLGGVYGFSYQNFKKSFERDWERVEKDGDSYYKLCLEIERGNIDYTFKSWFLDSRIDTFEYSVVAPGKIKVNGRGIYDVKIEDDVMEIKPALTSPDSYELWFK